MLVVFNGDFLDHNITGVQRYALEILRAIDELLEDESKVKAEILIPKDLHNVPDFKRIKIVRYKKNARIYWRQLHLMNYCKKRDAICVCLCTAAPYFYTKKSVVCVHDAAMFAHPEFYSKKYLFLNKILMWKRIRELLGIITVSEFSKKELMKYCDISDQSIIIAYNSAEHIEKVELDESVFNDYPFIQKSNYFYTLSSLSPNKNFNWIIEEARINPDELFVVTGMKLDVFADDIQKEIPENVIFTGYLTDEKVKALMSGCKTFLFPTFYEGFGIPPLEALYCGVPITVSDTPCMREIYDGTAKYIDPNKTDYCVDEIIGNSYNTASLLKKYSWSSSGKIVLDYIKGLG